MANTTYGNMSDTWANGGCFRLTYQTFDIIRLDVCIECVGTIVQTFEYSAE